MRHLPLFGVEYIATTFNTDTRKTILILAIYTKLHHFSTFLIHLKKLLDLMPCPPIIIDDFNIDMLDQNSAQ
jgi:hypothetical protein